ncbi:MAG: sensor histidine kinase [Actinobacteria bacterium HGW-Actinobacteria-10]|nr:MAG: sensor histidine kinase [Actinobacteria bacterium HGW-Actinobacteria-10]
MSALRRSWERRGTLSRRLAIAFAGVAALTMLLAAAILSFVWGGQFDAYVREGLQNTADGAARMLSSSYTQWGGWTTSAFTQLPRYGVLSGLALQVLNEDGEVIYDDTTAQSLEEHALMGRPMGASEPEGVVVTSVVESDGEYVGIVRVWPLSPQGLLSENDVAFRRSSFAGLFVAAIAAVLFASLAGLLFALSLVKPIDRITATAQALRGGNQDARTGIAGDDAIGLLGRTFDEMADAIEADREMERRLTADVAHELRTPLQAIQATVEAMQDGVYPADAEHLQVVRDETVRLSRLTSGILELTRLERGSVALKLERLDVAGPVRAAVDSHRVLFEAAGLELTEALSEGLVVDADRDRLTQAIGNLLSNAARYTPAGGSVAVSVGRIGERAVIEVADTGIGIAREDLDRVFSRFWRADDARDRATGGLGIGLAVVREIVERHGGIVYAALRDGGGSRFVVELPLAPA